MVEVVNVSFRENKISVECEEGNEISACLSDGITCVGLRQLCF